MHVSGCTRSQRLEDGPWLVKAEKCSGIEGIKQEHDDLQAPSPALLDSFLTGAGARAEHYEIAAYEGLIASAEAMGEGKVAELLSDNLGQEKEALQKMKKIGKRLARDSAAVAS
jgi:ferritin-like metal-binding protein YciE